MTSLTFKQSATGNCLVIVYNRHHIQSTANKNGKQETGDGSFRGIVVAAIIYDTTP